MNGWTLRLEGDSGMVSRDDGSSSRLTEAECSAVLQALEERRDWTLGTLTAAGRSALAESERINPRAGLWPRQAARELAPQPHVDRQQTPFAQLMATRVSERDLGPFGLATLASVLAATYGVRGQSQAPDGYAITHRGAPSAGGRHPITLMVIANHVADIEKGLYEYDPYDLRLLPRHLGGDAVDQVSHTVMEIGRLRSLPPAIVFLVCDFQRTLTRYPSGSGLVLLDAGALAAIIHLAAHDVMLASCIVGTSGLLERAGLDGNRQDIVAVAIGSRPDRSTI
jgi:SagB-type dehydrogenase family enzyme